MRIVLFPRLFLLMSFWLLISACSILSKDSIRQVPTESIQTSEKELELKNFSDVPGWDKDNLSEAMPAFLYSCQVLKKKPEWKEICFKAQSINIKEENEVRAFFETHLEPRQITLKDNQETGIATGYYEPILYGSKTQNSEYQIPLYSVPSDLISVNLSSIYPELKGLRLRGKLKGKKLVSYPTRAEIRQKKNFSAKEIVWVNDAVDAFFLQVQGSGRILLKETGDMIRLAYADQNGHPYCSIGKYLIEKGEMKLGEASAQRIKAWLQKNPHRLNEVLDANPSYVFFREEKLENPQVGPKGALGVPLTAMRSVAVDPQYIPLGFPLFIDTTEPNSTNLLQMMVMAQDTGSAIKGALRIDYFFGSGNEAGDLAGKMKQPVRIWMLQPKKLAIN